jgi:hypothetical protein
VLTMNNQEILELARYQSNWQRLRSYAETSNNYSYSQLKRLFHQRKSSKYAGLNHCFKLVGKTGYINEPLFGAWMAGLLTEQTMGAAA